MQPEYRIVQRVKKLIRSRGGWVVKVHGSPYQDKGTPDLLACYKGFFIAIEVKTPRGAAEPEQEAAQRGIIAAGGRALITHQVKEVESVLNTIDEL